MHAANAHGLAANLSQLTFAPSERQPCPPSTSSSEAHLHSAFFHRKRPTSQMAPGPDLSSMGGQFQTGGVQIPGGRRRSWTPLNCALEAAASNNSSPKSATSLGFERSKRLEFTNLEDSLSHSVLNSIVSPTTPPATPLKTPLSDRPTVKEPARKGRADIIERSQQVLRDNDFGGYTIPAKGLYPYQWNWDSALVAMGWSTFDEARGWEELKSLFSAQWTDGMVPHIVFHKPSPTYFPGPDIWCTPSQLKQSTGITQPPVAAISVRKMIEQSRDQRGALKEGGDLFPKLMAWHRWFYTARDPENTGLAATIHPWESGMDNSPMWDEALMRVPVDDIPAYVRKDLGHVDSAMRPHKKEYDRYLTLLYRFRALNYDPAQLYFISPFRVADVCTNSILHRANLDLRWLAVQLGEQVALPEIDTWLAKGQAAFDSLWDPAYGIYRSKDQLTGELIPAATSGGFLPLFARTASPQQAAVLAQTLERWLGVVKYGVPSFDPEDSRFEPLRYWRGPIWAIINWMIVDGLRAYGYEALAKRIEDDTIALTGAAGFFEYFNPVNGAGAGGGHFSWTAAMCLMWLDHEASEPGANN